MKMVSSYRIFSVLFKYVLILRVCLLKHDKFVFFQNLRIISGFHSLHYNLGTVRDMAGFLWCFMILVGSYITTFRLADYVKFIMYMSKIASLFALMTTRWILTKIVCNSSKFFKVFKTLSHLPIIIIFIIYTCFSFLFVDFVRFALLGGLK